MRDDLPTTRAAFALAALLALATGGVVAATAPPATTDAPAGAEPTAQFASPGAAAPAGNATLRVIDPRDDLNRSEVAAVRRLASANGTVRGQFGDSDSIHFLVQDLPDAPLTVFASANDTARPRVRVTVDLESASVTDAAVLDPTRVRTAGELSAGRLPSRDVTGLATGATTALRPASTDGTRTVDATATGDVDGSNASASSVGTAFTATVERGDDAPSVVPAAGQ